MGKHLLRIYSRLLAKIFHFTPNVGSAHRFATSSYKDRTRSNLLLCCIAEQFLLQFSDNEYRACFPLSDTTASPHFTASTVIYCSSLTRIPFRRCLDQQVRRSLPFFSGVNQPHILLWSTPFLQDSRSALEFNGFHLQIRPSKERVDY